MHALACKICDRELSHMRRGGLAPPPPPPPAPETGSPYTAAGFDARSNEQIKPAKSCCTGPTEGLSLRWPTNR